MTTIKRFSNGLKLVVRKIEGLLSVSCGVLVKTGSVNESEEENGLSHFIEHTVFKGTEKRSAFDISDDIDCIGAQINAFTSKEITCFYTKSTSEHLEQSMEILSDIFFNATFKEEELEKEKGVIIEEINMSEDTPEDLCLDLLAKGYYGDKGLGRTILGSINNIKRFTKKDVLKYMDKYYAADNVVISVAGNVDVKYAEEIAEKYFAEKFTRTKSAAQFVTGGTYKENLRKIKKIEQAHIGLCFPTFKSGDDRSDALAIANTVFGGGMSSRLFQKIREEMGLCYTVYSYPSQYKDSGVIEIYAGVNAKLRDTAANAVIDELRRINKSGVTKEEFLRGKEQVKSSLIMGQESTASQMLLFGKYLLFFDKEFDFDKRIRGIDDITLEQVNTLTSEYFCTDKLSAAAVGAERSALKLKL